MALKVNFLFYNHIIKNNAAVDDGSSGDLDT